MPSGDASPRRTWADKFRDAFRGVLRGIAGESSFKVHLAFAAAVIAAGVWFRITAGEWSLIVLCITLVFVAELLNSALELLAKAIDSRANSFIGLALDISSGAVLVAAIGTSVVGMIIFLPRALALLAL